MSRPEPTCKYDLGGRVAVVTGAAGAIGAGICRKLLQSNCRVAATDLAGERLEGVIAELEQVCWAERGRSQAGEACLSEIVGLPMDVTDPESVASAIAQIGSMWGGINIMVHVAGIPLVARLQDMDLDEFRRLERVNVEGTLLVFREMGKFFEKQGTGGDIVLISTKNVFSPGASFGAYSATKAAAHQLARIASLELAPIGVRVNMVAPDAVFGEGDRKSGLWQQIGPERMRARGLDERGLEEYYQNRNLLKARITPEHVANAVLFFVSRQTPTTGATIPVDGGLPDATPR
ncbi:MAG: SDR family NAD(P)-dependent oxidoreductase [Armatimonadota bacterium]